MRLYKQIYTFTAAKCVLYFVRISILTHCGYVCRTESETCQRPGTVRFMRDLDFYI